MSENDGASIDLSVNADPALQAFQELTSAAKDADASIQQLKQHMTEQVNAAFGAQGLRPQTYEQAQGCPPAYAGGRPGRGIAGHRRDPTGHQRQERRHHRRRHGRCGSARSG